MLLEKHVNAENCGVLVKYSTSRTKVTVASLPAWSPVTVCLVAAKAHPQANLYPILARQTLTCSSFRT